MRAGLCALSDGSPVRGNSVVPLVDVAAGSVHQRRAAWRAGEAVRWGLTRAEENRHRAELDLPRRLCDRGTTEAQAYDPAPVPGVAAEWGTGRPFAGSLDFATPAPDSVVESWSDGGSAPVYVGFGSMPVPDPAALLSDVAAMCRAPGVRALVPAGLREAVESRDERRRTVRSVDHKAVLPRCPVAVHHGGSGTTAAAVRAGVPSVVCPFSGDQQTWGGILTRLRVGTCARFTRPDATALRGSVAGMLAPDARQRARVLAERMIPVERAVSTAADSLLAAVRDHHDAVSIPQETSSASTSSASRAVSGMPAGSSPQTEIVVRSPAVDSQPSTPRPIVATSSGPMPG